MRFADTFGEHTELTVEMTRAYCDGFQTTKGSEDGWGADSVNTMVKHFPGGCGVLALLGFAACAETSVEYGTPTMDFWVRGKVISDDGKALKDIQVIVKNENAYYNDEEGELVRMNDTIYTDSGGEFVSQMMRDGWVDTKKLIFNDIDGEANGGTFKSDSVCMKDMESKQIKKGDGNWYLGTYEYNMEIKLSKEDK